MPTGNKNRSHGRSDMKSQFSQTTKKAASAIREQATEAAEGFRSSLDAAQETMASAASDATELGKDAVDTVRSGAVTLSAALQASIRRQPLTAMTIVAVVAYCFGVMSRRNTRSW